MPHPDLQSWEDVRDFFEDLIQKHQFVRYTINHHVVERLITPQSKLLQDIRPTDNDSILREYLHPEGFRFWKIDYLGPDDIEGIAWFSHYFLLLPKDKEKAIREADEWLGSHPEAYEWMVPIKWSSAPARAAEALDWLDKNRSLWETSPANLLFTRLYHEVAAVVNEST